MARLRQRDKTVTAFILILIAVTAVAQVPTGGAQIQGVVQSNRVPLPGTTVTVTNTTTSVSTSTVTDINGQYAVRVSGAGKYHVSVELAAFAPEEKDVDLTDATKPAIANFEMTLLSRTQRAQTQAPERGFRGRGGQAAQPAPTEAAAAPTTEQTDPLASALPDTALAPQGLGVQGVSVLPGMSADAPTESVAVAGNTASPAFGGMFDENRLAQLGFGGPDVGGRGFGGGDAGAGGFPGAAPGGAPGGGGRGGDGGGFGGRGGGPGGPGGFGGRGGGGGRGGPGGRGGFVLGGQRGRRNVNRPQINFGYTLGDSIFDAAPYSLRGDKTTKQPYIQNRFNATIGGPLVIPKIVNSTQNTNYNVTYSGTFLRNPFDSLTTVPTLAERNGDFSQSLIHNGASAGTPVQIPFAGNQIPSSMIDPSAAGLLKYFPQPNVPGATTQNFHYVTTNRNTGNNINVRLSHSFGAVQQGQRGQRGGFGGGRGGGRGGGGRGRSTISFGFQISSQNNTSNNSFPTLGGTSTSRGLNVPISFSKTFGKVTTNTNFRYNRNRTSAQNLFSNKQDIAAALGITGVSTDPLDWGLPTLSFTNYSSLNDVRPSLRLNQSYSLSESLGYFKGKHNIRFGGDVSHTQLNTHTGTNARGTFTFNGSRTGYDFADFLLGLPALSSVQYGSTSYKFLGNSWDLYVQDDWRLLGRLTLNLGLRYIYAAPLTEANNRLVNLDAAPDFTAVAPVLPGETGPYTGIFPTGLVNPDRNNFAPQVGLAWRATNRTIVRAGYGIQYNTGVYNSMIQQFAFQPPFSVTQTNIFSTDLPITLQNGFPTLPDSTVTNNFGVDKNYRVGYAQTWNLSVQRELPKGLTMSVDYTGTKGTRLDVLQAPNRTATGLKIEGVQPFTWESSIGNSIAHVGRLQLRRRLQYGISAGVNYTFSKALDDASSFGAGAGNIAQDVTNQRAERAVSSFDQPQRFSSDYLWQLPFGQNRRWMTGNSIFSRYLGDWQLQGTISFASSTPFTARVVGASSEIRQGTTGTLRADATGLPVALDHPTVDMWFNTAAFTVPAAGTYGNAARNTIRGPSTHQLDMSLNKNLVIGDRAIDLRIQATNVFNMPQYRGIDTTVNSPTFGRVTSVGPMRKVQIIARYRF